MFRKIWDFFFGKRIVTIVFVGDAKSGYVATDEDIKKVKDTIISGGIKDVIALPEGSRIEIHRL